MRSFDATLFDRNLLKGWVECLSALDGWRICVAENGIGIDAGSVTLCTASVRNGMQATFDNWWRYLTTVDIANIGAVRVTLTPCQVLVEVGHADGNFNIMFDVDMGMQDGKGMDCEQAGSEDVESIPVSRKHTCDDDDGDESCPSSKRSRK